jgi:hypothetical protein
MCDLEDAGRRCAISIIDADGLGIDVVGASDYYRLRL